VRLVGYTQEEAKKQILSVFGANDASWKLQVSYAIVKDVYTLDPIVTQSKNQREILFARGRKICNNFLDKNLK